MEDKEVAEGRRTISLGFSKIFSALYFSLNLHPHPQDRVSLCTPGCPVTHSVDQAAFELRDPPTPAF